MWQPFNPCQLTQYGTGFLCGPAVRALATLTDNADIYLAVPSAAAAPLAPAALSRHNRFAAASC